MALQLSPALLVYLSFFASNYKIPRRSTSIMYELSLDMVTVLHSPTVDGMLRRGFLLPSQGCFPSSVWSPLLPGWFMCADTEHSQLPRRKWNLTLRKDLLSVKLALSCNCAKYHQQEPIWGFYCYSTQEIPSLSHVCPWKRYWGYPMYLVTSSFLINSHKVQTKDTQLLGEGRTKTVTWQIKKLVLNKCSLNNSTPEPTRPCWQNTSTEEPHFTAASLIPGYSLIPHS